MLNARLRKLWLTDRCHFLGLIGEAVDLTYDYAHLGGGGEALAGFAESGGAFAKAFAAAGRR